MYVIVTLYLYTLYLRPGEGAGSAADRPNPSILPLWSVLRVMMSTMPLFTRLQAEAKLLVTVMMMMMMMIMMMIIMMTITS